jgi:nicotinamidase-related amidase
MNRALVIVDIQNDYFPGGAFPLVEPERAVAAAQTALEAFRAAGEPVVHVQHVWDEPEASFMRPDTPGVEIHPALTPAEDERVIVKGTPNSFLRTPLQQHLRWLGAKQIVVCGMMTSLCVDATVRAGADLGFSVTLLEDACACRDLEFGGVTVPAKSVTAAFLAPLAENYAEVLTVEELRGAQ